MAGRFVSLEEAARLLGVSMDEVNRLVDRKKLFPMRDGATVKFRTCLLYTSPSPRDGLLSRMPSSA